MGQIDFEALWAISAWAVILTLVLGGLYCMANFALAGDVPVSCIITYDAGGAYTRESWTLRGILDWRDDIDLGRFSSRELAIRSADDNHCPLRGGNE